MKRKTSRFEPELTSEERYIVDQTLATGNLNLFSERFFRVPNGGSRWLPGDSLGHYRHLFEYEMLYSAWRTAGKPDIHLTVKTPEYEYALAVIWEGDTPKLPAPSTQNINIVMPIMPAPGSLQPVRQFTVVSPSGSETVISAAETEEVVEGEITSSSSEK